MGSIPPQALACVAALFGSAAATAGAIALSGPAGVERAQRLPALATAASSGLARGAVDAANAGEADAGEAGAALASIATPPAWSPTSRAAVYGALSSDACETQLRGRGIRYAPASGAPLVERPIRLAGPLHGVTFHGEGVAKATARSLFDIADCRLVLALDDLAASLERRGVVEVVHVSMHRPAPAGVAAPPRAGKKAAPQRGSKALKSASKSAGKSAGSGPRFPTKPAAAGKRPSQHALGLAIDVAAFVKADGSRIEVKADWHGAIGAPPCGPGSEPRQPTPQAVELRELVCAVYASGLFNVVLTPNANAEHADHFHFDIKRDARYFLME